MNKNKIKVENLLGMKFRVREKNLGGETAKTNRERSRRNDLKLLGSYIWKNIILDKSSAIESCRELKSTRKAIEELSRGFHNKGA